MQLLMTPGPTPIPRTSLEAESQPIIHHRTKEFAKLFNDVQENLKYVFQTKNKVYTLMSSGTGIMECAVANLVSPGDEVLVISCGVFGERWVKILRQFGADIYVVKAKPGEIVTNFDEVKHKPKFVFCTHTDTSTAVVCPVADYAKSFPDSIIVVDAISGMGGEPLKMDEWNLDVVISASQKGLMSSPGLSFISLNKRAWEAVQVAKSPRFYWDLRTMDKSFEEDQTPFTPAVTLLRCLDSSLKMIKEKGLEKIWEETASMAQMTRELGQEMGLQLFSKNPCNVLTAFYCEHSEYILDRMIAEHNISIAGGQVELKNKIIRIAHMGYIQPKDIIATFDALKNILKENL